MNKNKTIFLLGLMAVVALGTTTLTLSAVPTVQAADCNEHYNTLDNGQVIHSGSSSNNSFDNAANINNQQHFK